MPRIHTDVPDNWLNAKELFWSKTLCQLQTDYAATINPIGWKAEPKAAYLGYRRNARLYHTAIGMTDYCIHHGGCH
ncbi:hypothetical protein GCM10028817_03900 [Spirosoma pomorum]|jgi:hypothetical protein